MRRPRVAPPVLTYGGSVWRPSHFGQKLVLAAGTDLNITVNKPMNVKLYGAAGGAGGAPANTCTGGGAGAVNTVGLATALVPGKTYATLAGSKGTSGLSGTETSLHDGAVYLLRLAGGTITTGGTVQAGSGVAGGDGGALGSPTGGNGTANSGGAGGGGGGGNDGGAGGNGAGFGAGNGGAVGNNGQNSASANGGIQGTNSGGGGAGGGVGISGAPGSYAAGGGGGGISGGTGGAGGDGVLVIEYLGG